MWRRLRVLSSRACAKNLLGVITNQFSSVMITTLKSGRHQFLWIYNFTTWPKDKEKCLHHQGKGVPLACQCLHHRIMRKKNNYCMDVGIMSIEIVSNLVPMNYVSILQRFVEMTWFLLSVVPSQIVDVSELDERKGSSLRPSGPWLVFKVTLIHHA